MILIDASNINSGGGEVLLKYLIESLDYKGENYFVIADPRWKNNSIPLENQEVVKISIFNRKSILENFIKLKNPTTLLLFGNFPPPFKVIIGIKTVTYIQNNLVINWRNSKHQTHTKILYLFIVRFYIQLFIKNSKYYCFQNNNTKNDFIQSYGITSGTEYKVLPFFKIKVPEISIPFVEREDSFIYVSSDLAHKNHKNLLLAWEYNFTQGINNILYITIDESKETETTQLYNALKFKKVPIINLGKISQNEVFEQCQKIKYAVFPSFIETIGLNMVESASLGCKVLASNLSYVDEVIKPSLRFDPNNLHDIAEKVKFALSNDIPETKVVMENKIEEFINFLL